MTRIIIPRGACCSSKIVSSTDFELYFCKILPTYAECGWVISDPDCGLEIDIASGNARFLGLHLQNTASCTVTCLTMCATNHIYAQVTRDACCKVASWAFTTNTTGVTPAISFKIGTATTNATEVTATSQCFTPRCVLVGAVDSDIQVYPHSTTLCDYTIPCSAISSSTSVCAFFNDVFCYATQCLADTAWASSSTNFMRVNICCDFLTIHTERDGTKDAIVHDLGAVLGNCWTLRFEGCVNNFNLGGNHPFYFFGLSDSNQCTASDAAQDWAGILHNNRTGCACMYVKAMHTVAGAPTTSPLSNACNECWIPVTCTTYYWELKRTSVTSITFDVFSCACFCMSVLCCPTTDTSISATTCGLRYIKWMTWTNGVPTGGFMDIDIPCLCFKTDTTGLAIDDCNCTEWTSDSEVAPSITVGLPCCSDVVALMIRPKCTTTVTEFKVRARPTNMCFTDSDNVRTITYSDLTECADNFIRFNRSSIDDQFVQLIGSDTCAKTFSITELKILAPTDVTRRHGHQLIDACDASLQLDGTQ